MINEENLNKLYRYAISLTKDDALAYDILQSGLEKALKVGLDSMENPMAYLKTIIRNVFFDLERRKKIVPFISLDSEEGTYYEETTTFTLEELMIQENDVSIILGKLQPQERELLYLWAVEEYTAEEISQLNKVPRGTVLSRLHRLKAKIKKDCQHMPELALQVPQ